MPIVVCILKANKFIALMSCQLRFHFCCMFVINFVFHGHMILVDVAGYLSFQNLRLDKL